MRCARTDWLAVLLDELRGGLATPALEGAVERTGLREAQAVRHLLDGGSGLGQLATRDAQARFVQQAAERCSLCAQPTAQRAYVQPHLARDAAHVDAHQVLFVAQDAAHAL